MAAAKHPPPEPPNPPLDSPLAPDATIHHTPRRHPRRIGAEKMQPNLTSMIDVVFQLLIFFVVTSSFAIGEGVLTAKMPTGPGKPQQTEKPPTRPIKILVSSVGPTGTAYRIQIKGMPDELESFSVLSKLLTNLQFDPKRNPAGVYKPDDPVIIQPSGDVRWQHVVNAFNAAVTASYTNIRFAHAKPAGS